MRKPPPPRSAAHALRTIPTARQPAAPARLTEGIYRRGKVYWLRYRTGGGKRVFVSLQTGDPASAILAAERLRAEQATIPQDRWAVEVERYVAERRGHGKLSVHFAVSRRHCLLNEGIKHGWRTAEGLTTAIVQRWYDDLRVTNCENTAMTYLGNLRAFLNWMVEKRKLAQNPARGVVMARTRAVVRTKFCGREVVRRLLDAATEPELKFALFCGFHAGMRRGEIDNARPDWFDLAAGRIDIRVRDKKTLGPTDPGWAPKFGRERSVPMTREFQAFMVGGAMPMDGDFVLRPQNKLGRAKYRYDWIKTYRAHLRTCKVSGVTMHDMRRTFASLLVMKGVSLVKVAKWLGDGHQITFEHYSHLIPDNDRDIEAG